MRLNRKRRSEAGALFGLLGIAFCFALLFCERFFEERQLPPHYLHVVDFLDRLTLVLHGIFVIAGSIIAAAQGVEETAEAGFTVHVQLNRAMRITDRPLEIAFGVAHEPGPLVVRRSVRRILVDLPL